MTKNDKVRVLWTDAHTITDTWIAEEDIKSEPCLVESIGWLLKNKVEGHIVLAQSWNISADEPEYDGVLAIPCGMVVSIDPLFMEQSRKED